MATPSEQKALAFVAMIVLLGGVVRVVRAGAPPNPSSVEQQALARQAVAAESAAADKTAPGSRNRKGRKMKVARPESANPSSGFSGVSTVSRAAGIAREPVDLDRATEREIELLPWIGPALAGRIVANRDSFGPFGSIEALGRVKGMGQATRKRLASLVTFSGGPSSRR